MKFPLPKGWVWARCHDVIDVRDGTHDTPNKVESGIPMVTSKNLKPYGIDFDDVTYISEEDYEAIEKRSGVDDGDILFAMIGTIGNPVLVKKDRPFSIKNVALFKIDEMKVHAPFFKFMLDSPVITQQLDANSRGGNQKFVSLSSLRNMQLPLPPLPEQKRIAAILDKADSIRRKRQEAVRLTEEMLRSVFLEIFGDPVTNPKGWAFRNLGDVCDVRDGTHDSPKYVTEGGYPLVTSKNLTGGTVDLTDVNFISETDYDQINKRSRVDCGDIIMPMIGTIGSPVLVDQEPNYAIKNIALIKCTKQSPSAVFVLHLLSSHYFDHIIGQKSRGGTQQFVSLGDLRSFPLPLPPSELQTEFARRISAVEKLRNSHLRSMSELDALFNALLQRAFKGELY